MAKPQLTLPWKQPPVGQLVVGDCLQLLRRMPAASVDVVVGSPPYAEKGQRYGENWAMPTEKWVPWMVNVTAEALRIARNVVIWIVNGSVHKGCYRPACEGLVWSLYQKGISCERPVIWHKNSPPSRKDWFTNDWEFCLAFRPPESTRFFDYKQIATPPKFQSGGQFRQRGKDGQRRLGGQYPQNDLTRPRDVIFAEEDKASDVVRATVGGGHMGSKLASENEAPFPENLVRPLLKVTVPQGGIVLDPFAGSGTVPAVAEELGMQWIGFDVRESQAELAMRRIAEKRQALQEQRHERKAGTETVAAVPAKKGVRRQRP